VATKEKDIILRFRQVIRSRYNTYACIAGAVLVFVVGLFFIFKTSGIILSFIFLVFFLSLGTIWYVLFHRNQMLFRLDSQYPESFQRLEQYVEEMKQKQENFYWIRMVLGCGLAIGMFLFLFLSTESVWTLLFITLFLAMILASMIKGWLDFNDHILMQDFRRSLRDQPSDTST
jgi:hypothetical protein